MSTRSGRVRLNVIESSLPKTRKGTSPSRSPARARKRSPILQSAPNKSPSRKSPSRKSPARKSKNISSKSPTRTIQESDPKVGSLTKRGAIRPEVQLKLKDTSDLDSYRRNTRSGRTEYSIKDIQPDISRNELIFDNNYNSFDPYLTTLSDHNIRNRKPMEDVTPRRSSRLKELAENTPDIRRSTCESISDSKSLSKSISKSIEPMFDEDNSEDDILRRKSVSVTRRLATPLRNSIGKLNLLNNEFEFGGIFGSIFLIILIPITVFSILNSRLNLWLYTNLFDLSKYKSVTTLFNYKSLLLILAQYMIQAMFVVLPIFGRKEQSIEKGKKQCFNAFFSCIFTLIFLFTTDYLKLIDTNEILSSYLSLAAISYTFALLLAIFLYAKSSKLDSSVLNSYGNTGYFVNDFLAGREIHTSLKSLNIKLWFSRTANINALILLLLISKHGFQLQIKDVQMFSLEKCIEFISKVPIKPTALLYSVMQIIYISYFILIEDKITSTFFWQYEGLGYLLLVSSALYPYYFTSVSKYVVDVDLEMSTNALIAALTLFLVGIFIMLISNNIKHQFRKDPLHPSITRLESMPTFHGNKLLVSNLWGIVRHPNYAGDILIHIALALPGILTWNVVAALPAILTALVLLHRAWRDHIRCAQRYGAAWNRYCKRVPSLLIPKIL